MTFQNSPSLDFNVNSIVLSNTSRALIVDTSYYIFYRYFSTLRWYSFKDKDKQIDYQNIHLNQEFIEPFKKHIRQDIEKWRNKWSIKNPIILCKDCPRSTIWRTEIYPEYKSNRVQQETFNGNIFDIFYKYIKSDEIIQNKKIGELHVLECNKLEADDIAYLTLTTLKNLNFSNDIIILTNDNDYLQLKQPKVYLYNMQSSGFDITSRSKGTPEIDLLIKICMGDVSDNITPICKKLGPVTAKKLAEMSDEKRTLWIHQKGEECINKFNRNKILISFTSIPSEYIDIYKSLFTFNVIE